jgi:hypothetical protein
MRFPASGGGDFQPCAEGTHVAVCNMIVDLGTQPGSALYPEPKPKVYFRFEIPSERIEYVKDGQDMEGPRVVGQEYTASMNAKSNLRRDIEAWRGTKFKDDGDAESYDIATLLGKPCLVSVVHKTNAKGTFANIGAIMALPKGTVAPKAENIPFLYETGNDAAYAKLPAWLQKKVDGQLSATPAPSTAARSSSDPDDAAAAQQAATRKPPQDDPNDEIPF